MTQEGNSDLFSKFSTLNVNAMEFVPSFASSVPAAAAPATATTPAESTPDAEPASTQPSSQNASPTKTNDELPVAVAAPPETIDDKSPDNPGSYTFITFRVIGFSLLLDIHTYRSSSTVSSVYDSIDGMLFMYSYHTIRFEAV